MLEVFISECSFNGQVHVQVHIQFIFIFYIPCHVHGYTIRTQIKLDKSPLHSLLNTLLPTQVVVRHNTVNIRLATFLAAGVARGPIAANFTAATVETGGLFGVGGRLVHVGPVGWLPRAAR